MMKNEKLTLKEYNKHLRESLKKQQLDGMVESFTRARSVTVGTAFGGTIEISMRRPDNVSVHAILQPVETIELIHQIAAAVGCHIHIKPRSDFSSWRRWNENNSSALGWEVPKEPQNNIDAAAKLAVALPQPLEQPGLQTALIARSESNEQTVATQKTVGRKRTKRAATAA